MRTVLGQLTEDQKKSLATWAEIPASSRVRYQEELMLEKWARTGWLNPDDAKKESRPVVQEFHDSMAFPKLANDRQRRAMAMLLENQTQFQRGRRIDVIDGPDGKKQVHLVQDTATSHEALPTKFALPIV